MQAKPPRWQSGCSSSSTITVAAAHACERFTCPEGRLHPLSLMSITCSRVGRGSTPSKPIPKCWPATAPARSKYNAALAGKYQLLEAADGAATSQQHPSTAASLTRVYHAPNMTATAVFHRLCNLRQHAPQLLQCRRIRHASGMQGWCNGGHSCCICNHQLVVIRTQVVLHSSLTACQEVSTPCLRPAASADALSLVMLRSRCSTLWTNFFALSASSLKLAAEEK
jgi:hypothetical protein